MPRLFSALELPGSVRAELGARLRGPSDTETDLTWVRAGTWHITLGFYGDREDADWRGAWLRRQVTGLAPARLRLSGAGRFPGVLWVGVTPFERRDETALQTLAAALNGDNDSGDHGYTAHVTVARWRGGAAAGRSASRMVRELTDYRGTWWTATEVILFRSDRATDHTGRTGPVYTPIDRVSLGGEQG